MSRAKKAAQVKVPGTSATFGEVLRAVLLSKPKKKAARKATNKKKLR